MNAYGQYCPISRTAEILGDRWTIHIVRDLLTGSSRFNELVRGNPGLSRALLTRRLRQLRTAGIVEHTEDGNYVLTAAGRDLEPVVFGLAAWGARWTFGEPAPEELDPDILLWWLHRQLDADEFRTSPFTVAIRFTDHAKRYWIVITQESSLCLTDPGFEIDVHLETTRRALFRTYLGHIPLGDAIRHGDVTLIGSPAAVRTFTHAFRPSPVADIVAAQTPR